jgi:hypothetical protein
MIRFALAIMISAIFLTGCSQTSDSRDQNAAAGTADENETVELLFVQNSKAMSYDGETLTMEDADPYTLFFSDRPERIAGHLKIAVFIEEVSKGADSFAEDPPNATLVVFDGDELHQVVLELPTKPQYRDGDLLFDVRVIEGNVPESGGASALFIDTVGRPLSPGSVAGVHRREKRRHHRR